MSAPVMEEQTRIQRKSRFRRMRLWMRGLLLLMTACLVAVFGIALLIDPYQDGRVWYQETHTQLGLPECTFKRVTKAPCPSCGMTTSFALLMHGDLVNSIQANFVGTGLAIFGLFLIPWCVASAYRGKYLFVRSIENTMARCVAIFFVVLLVRWGVVLLLAG